MLRGNGGQPVFYSNADRCRMCLLIQEGVERFGHSIHSFCFMTNHLHLAIEVRDTNISRIMQNLTFRYTRYFNKIYKRSGHLFQGRFKSIVVDGNRYLQQLTRYIHLNPVRAGLVNQPEEYPWSSHRAYLQLTEYAWLTCDNVLKKFGISRKGALTCYERYILNGIGIDETLDFTSGHSDGILGDEQFVDEFLETAAGKGIQKRNIQLSELVTIVCNRFNLSETILRAPGKNRLESHARAVLALLVREAENISIEELGVFLTRDPSGLGKLANRLEKKCSLSPIHAVEMDDLRKCIYNKDLQMSECPA